MSDTSNPGADPRVRENRIRGIVSDCIRRRTEGDFVSDESLIEANSDLMPELANQLRKLRLVEAAQRQVDETVSSTGHSIQIRCPHCQNRVEFPHDTKISDVTCTACGSTFGLIDDPQLPEEEKLQRIGHFELMKKVGVGAFGTVWLAHDTELDRLVAIKIPRQGRVDAEYVENIMREARTAAQLDHPRIVRVHEVGREGDRLYIVTDFVEGRDLGQWLSDGQVTPREAAELCATIAEALDHAHQRGVIHRDLKPSNIMVDGQGNPHLMDFGLAKREAREVAITFSGKLLGTPAYMSPEQARGAAQDTDRRSDVYSLGVILYELLTGERPFRGTTRMLLHQILVEDARAPRNLNTRFRRTSKPFV